MNAPSAKEKPSSLLPRLNAVWAGVIIVLAGLAAYHSSFSGSFIFDDDLAIPQNPTIRHLWPIGPVLSPPPDTTASGRPALNLSLAINYALGGSTAESYHALNLAIHILAGLTLFGIVRRTLLQPRLRERFGSAALPLALTVAVLWTVHPLQTEAVTYIIQRAESLMGLFYLLTLYCFIRGAESRPGLWHALSITACLLGMATKEVMVTAPVMVLLCDRTFVAGTFRSAWNQRWRFYLGLAGTWILLGYLVLGTGGDRSGTIGFDVGVAWWAYGLTQFGAIVRYLWLSVWPHPLVFDYGTYWIKHPADVVPSALIVIPLAVLTVIGLWRWPVIGFLGMWFFGILAPTSLVPGITQMTVEHRMYLPLAAVLVLIVTEAYLLAGFRSLIIFAAMAVGFGFLTARRNEDYRSDLTIWRDTAAKRPDNSRAHYNLGNDLFREGRAPEAIAQYQEALQLKPDYTKVHNNLGYVFFQTGRVTDAIAEYQSALRLEPNYFRAHYNLGNALLQINRVPEAIAEYQAAVRLDAENEDAHYNLGIALAGMAGRKAEAIRQFEEVLRLDPDNADARSSLAELKKSRP